MSRQKERSRRGGVAAAAVGAVGATTAAVARRREHLIAAAARRAAAACAGRGWVEPLEGRRLFAVTPAGGPVLKHENFETAPLSGWTRDVQPTSNGPGGGGTIAVVDANAAGIPIRSGTRAARFTLPAGNQRSELYAKSDPAGSERWYASSIYIPADYADDPYRDLVMQWHEVPDWHLGETWRVPPLSLSVNDGRWEVATRWDRRPVNNDNSWDPPPQHGGRTDYYTPLAKGTWTDWVFHVDWSYEADGVLEVWQNGRKVVDHRGPNTFNDRAGNYFKFGVYHPGYKLDQGNPASARKVVFHDEVKIGGPGATLTDMSPGPRPVPPPPVPPPPPTSPPPPVAGPALNLLDSTDDSVIAPLTNGYVIDMGKVGTRLNVRATPTGTPGSLVFRLDGRAVSTESYAPYSVGGDTNGAFNDWTPTAGNHTLVVTQYSGPGGTGNAIGSTSVSFTAVAPQSPPPKPLPAPPPPPAGPSSGSFAGLNVGTDASGSTTAGGPGAWVVRGAGNGLAGTSDAFHFARQTRTGNFDVKARLTSLTGGAAGLIVRNGTHGPSSGVSLQYGDGGVHLGVRDGYGKSFSIGRKGSAAPGNLWLRMKRSGNTFAAYYSSNGSAWTTAGTVTIGSIQSKADFGFSVAGGVNNLVTARFENVAG